MGETTIEFPSGEWTNRTWSPVTGCSKVSAGCKNCYAERIFPRSYSKDRVPLVQNGRDPDPARDSDFRPRQFTDVRWHPDRLERPLHWRRPQRIFVNSMSDLFHEDVPFEFIDKVRAVMQLTPQHTYQILTKRPERMHILSAALSIERMDRLMDWVAGFCDEDAIEWAIPEIEHMCDKPLPNVWLVVSVENQPTADERIPILLQTPAAVRGVSYEPALSAVDFTQIKCVGAGFMNALTGQYHETDACTDGLDWVIIGGESGPGARPFNIQWARDVIAQCEEANVARFVKQLGTNPVRPWDKDQDPVSLLAEGEDESEVILQMVLDDRKGGNMAEWPEDLRVRELPFEPPLLHGRLWRSGDTQR